MDDSPSCLRTMLRELSLKRTTRIAVAQWTRPFSPSCYWFNDSSRHADRRAAHCRRSVSIRDRALRNRTRLAVALFAWSIRPCDIHSEALGSAYWPGASSFSGTSPNCFYWWESLDCYAKCEEPCVSRPDECISPRSRPFLAKSPLSFRSSVAAARPAVFAHTGNGGQT